MGRERRLVEGIGGLWGARVHGGREVKCVGTGVKCVAGVR